MMSKHASATAYSSNGTYVRDSKSDKEKSRGYRTKLVGLCFGIIQICGIFNWNMMESLAAVSYTHLTLPTNREV